MVVEQPRQPWLPSHDSRWPTEDESAAEFDRRVAECGLFANVYPEVSGYYLTHRPNREEKDARIDRVLFPGEKLKQAGWLAPVGIELKRSDGDFGHAVSQAIDYTYCIFNVGPYWLHFEKIFVWPFAMPGGPLQSVMIQNGIGVVHGRFYSQKYGPRDYPDTSLNFQLERNILAVHTDGTIECNPWQSGHRKGSR